MIDNRQTTCQNNYRGNSRMNTSMNPRTASAPARSKKELMEHINRHSFAMNEANLFLDTHPYDTEALAYFQKQRALRVEAIKEYERNYAPLVIDCASSDKTPWKWVNEPWPWEGVEC